MSYADNVAEMFSKFTKGGGFCFLTANLQAGGVAEPLLGKVKSKEERANRVINLLSYSRLSDVQEKAKVKFNNQLIKLMGE